MDDAHLAATAHGLSLLDADLKRAPGPADPALLAEAGRVVFIDFEMSGANAGVHEILEAGAVRATWAAGLPEEASWGKKVRPRRIGNAEPGALKVSGYNPKAWREAIELDAAVAELVEVARGAVIAGWGLGNDLAFLADALRRSSIDWPFAPVVLDVQPVARKVLAGTGSVDRFNLGHVADRLGIGRMGEHSALADAYATYDVMLKLLERVPGVATGTPPA